MGFTINVQFACMKQLIVQLEFNYSMTGGCVNYLTHIFERNYSMSVNSCLQEDCSCATVRVAVTVKVHNNSFINYTSMV